MEQFKVIFHVEERRCALLPYGRLFRFLEVTILTMRFHSFLVVASIIGLGALPTDQRSIATRKAGKFEYIGVNESGPEFGEKKFPGVKNKDV